MVPDGWQTTTLGKLFKSRRERGIKGLPTLSVTLYDGLVLRDSLDRKTETNLSPEEHLLVRKGDIAYNMMRMWQGASGLAPFDALVSPAYVVLQPRSGIDPVFASYFLKSARMIYLHWAYSYGLTKDRLRLYFPDFSLIPAIIPPLEEQRRIGEALSAWDQAIDTIDKLIEKRECEKRALMQKLVTGNRRLPGFDRAWTAKPLKSLGPFKKGKGLSREQLSEQGLPCILYGDIYTKYDDVVRKFTSFIPRDLASASQHISKGDLLFTASGETAEEIGKCVAYLGDGDAYAGGDILIQSPQYDDPEFLGYALNHGTAIKQRARFAQGHSIVHISAANLGSIVLPIPERREQEAIASVISCADRAARNLSLQRSCLLAEKVALREQLISGQHRVNVKEGTPRVSAVG